MIKKSLLMMLISFNVSCTTITPFEPIECLGQPDISLNFTQEEFDAIPKTALKKIKVFAKTLRARIDAQCEVVEGYSEINYN